MSIGLSPESIADFHSCVHRELLSYVSYPSSELAPRCFAYPQFLLEEDRLTLLEKSAFPDEGCLPMVMADTSASDMARRFGNIVIMVVNDGQPQDNRNYPDKEGARFNSIINPTFSKGKSAVEFTALSKHRLSSELMQVLDIQERRRSLVAPRPSRPPLSRRGGAPDQPRPGGANHVRGRATLLRPLRMHVLRRGGDAQGVQLV
ncbi:MAG TPA: hypothetical protein H9823_01080 [Candidatus Rubneribacter avistercoris]|nr:hypothetical protein [Candidatus Rubneribacter avistercoris]